MAVKNRRPKPLIISPQAKEDILNILEYLKNNWHQKVIDTFLQKLRAFYTIVATNPHLFGYHSKNKNIRKYLLTKQNIIFYRNKKDEIEIITVYDGRQNPQKLKKILR